MPDQKTSRIRRHVTWLLLLLKRQMKRPLLWVMMGVMVLTVMTMHYVTMPSARNRVVLLYSEETAGSSFGTDLMKELLRRSAASSSVFTFEEAQSREELEKRVLEGNAECGFLFPENMESLVESGTTDQLITYVASSYTTKGEVAKETVFSAFFAQYGEILLKQQQETIFGTTDGALEEQIRARYEDLLQGDEVFQARYETVGGQELPSTAEKTAAQPLRGLIMLLLGMELLLLGSEKFYGFGRFFGKALPGREKMHFDLLLYFTGALPMAAAGLFLIRLLDPSVPFAKDVFLYMVFWLWWILWAYAFGRICRNGLSYLSYIMTFLLAQLLLCPIWTDLSESYAAVYPLSFLFPTGAYLRVLTIVMGG